MKKLHSLEVKEISLVPRGANKKKYLVFKSEKGSSMPNDIKKQVQELMNSVPAATMAKVEEVCKAFGKKDEMSKNKMPMDSKMEKAAGGLAPEGSGPDDRAVAALKACARILAPFVDQLGDEHMDAMQEAIGMKGGAENESPEDAPPEEGMEKGIGIGMSAPDGVEKEHHDEALGMAKAAYKAQMEKLGYQKYPTETEKSAAEKAKMEKAKKAKKVDPDEEEEEDMEKSGVEKSALDLSAFPEAQRKQMEAVFKAANAEKAELVKKNADLQKELNKREVSEKEREYVAKAETFTHVGMPKDEIVAELRDAAAQGTKAYERVVKRYDSWNTQNKEGGLFKEIGSNQSNAGAGSSEAKLNALVDSIVQKTGDVKSRAIIYDEVIQTAEGKKLMAEAMNEQGGN